MIASERKVIEKKTKEKEGNTNTCIYIYIYIEREREREKERACVCVCEWVLSIYFAFISLDLYAQKNTLTEIYIRTLRSTHAHTSICAHTHTLSHYRSLSLSLSLSLTHTHTYIYIPEYNYSCTEACVSLCLLPGVVRKIMRFSLKRYILHFITLLFLSFLVSSFP